MNDWQAILLSFAVVFVPLVIAIFLLNNEAHWTDK
jgi:hypothetical protein